MQMFRDGCNFCVFVIRRISGPGTSAPMVRILIADDHEMIRHGLRELLEQREVWEVCAEASNGRAAVEFAGKLHPKWSCLI